MVINGKEIKFSIMKKSDAKRFEEAVKAMGVHEAEIKKKMAANERDGKAELSPILDEFIDMFREFFTTATGVDVIGDCDDAVEVKAMYMAFLGEVTKQKKGFLTASGLSRIK